MLPFLHVPNGFFSRTVLEEREAAIYMACENGDSVRGVQERIRKRGISLDEAAVRNFLMDLVALRFVHEENGQFLSLAIPENRARAQEREAIGLYGSRREEVVRLRSPMKRALRETVVAV